jgi:hypothetical protein
MENQDPSPLETAILTYYRAPRPDHLADLFAAEVVTDRWRAQTVLTLPVFLAHLFDSAPATARRIVADTKGGDAVKIEVVAQALNYCHIDGRQKLMESLAGEAAAGSMDLTGADFLDFSPTHPVHVDMLWAAFFASGRTEYIDKIAGLLAGWLLQPELQALLNVAAQDESVREKALAGVLADAALWSLTVNARDHDRVHDALSAFAGRMDGLACAMAARILAGISQTRQVPET